MMEDKTDGIRGVVRHGKGLDRDVTHHKLGASEEEPEILAAGAGIRTLNRIRGKGVAKNRSSKFLAENLDPCGVIDVFMGNKDGVDGRGFYRSSRKAGANLAGTEPAINQQAAGGGLDESAISGAARAEDGHSEHMQINGPGTLGKQSDSEKSGVATRSGSYFLLHSRHRAH